MSKYFLTYSQIKTDCSIILLKKIRNFLADP